MVGTSYPELGGCWSSHSWRPSSKQQMLRGCFNTEPRCNILVYIGAYLNTHGETAITIMRSEQMDNEKAVTVARILSAKCSVSTSSEQNPV